MALRRGTASGVDLKRSSITSVIVLANWSATSNGSRSLGSLTCGIVIEDCLDARDEVGADVGDGVIDMSLTLVSGPGTGSLTRASCTKLIEILFAAAWASVIDLDMPMSPCGGTMLKLLLLRFNPSVCRLRGTTH